METVWTTTYCIYIYTRTHTYMYIYIYKYIDNVMCMTFWWGLMCTNGSPLEFIAISECRFALGGTPQLSQKKMRKHHQSDTCRLGSGWLEDVAPLANGWSCSMCLPQLSFLYGRLCEIMTASHRGFPISAPEDSMLFWGFWLVNYLPLLDKPPPVGRWLPILGATKGILPINRRPFWIGA